jgi:peptide/nickel transport system substrate-binding protein
MTRIRLVAGTIVLALLAASCSSAGGGAAGGSGGSGGSGGVFKWGTTSPIDSLNPFVAVQQNSFYTFEYVYPFLVQYGPKLQITPDFARSWQVTDGGDTITFQTRSGARWSDGKPLTARDAAWTISTVLKFQSGPTASEAGAVNDITSATAPNATTLVVHYKHPSADALPALQGMPILPEHIWSPLATGKGTQLKTFANSAPIVAGGPFSLVSYKQGQVALFQPNPRWWGPRPHISGFGIQFFTDSDAMIQALRNHQIDATEGEPLPPTAISALRGDKLTIAQTTGFGFRNFIINSNPKKKGNRELLNPLVRAAFAHAIDRAQIVKTAWLGYALPGSSVLSPAYGIWSDPSLHPETFNLALANQLLNQAGYRMGPGGVRTANGHPMSYKLLFASDEHGPGDRAFTIIQGDFAKIGVQLNERVLDPSAEESALLGNNNDYQGWDLGMWDWSSLPADPSFMLDALTCTQWGGWSDSGYCNKSYDALNTRQLVDLNQASRLSLFRQMQQQLYNARPYIVLTYDEWTEARIGGWAGFVLSPVGSFNQFSDQTMLQLHQTG